MNQEIYDLINKLSKSEPIFDLHLSNDKCTMFANVQNEYHPQVTDIPDNVLWLLVCDKHTERFSIHDQQFVFSKSDIHNDVMNEIKSKIAEFIERNMNVRNPRLTKVYKYTQRDMFRNLTIEDELVSIYKWMNTFCDVNMNAAKDKEEYVETAIALLEAMQEHYER